MDRDDPAYRGQADYTPLLLDPTTCRHRFVAGLLWRVPGEPLIEDYRRNIRRQHLEVGPGTGYFIDRVRAPRRQQADDPGPEPECPSAQRHEAAEPVSTHGVEADVLKPLPVEGPSSRPREHGVPLPARTDVRAKHWPSRTSRPSSPPTGPCSARPCSAAPRITAGWATRVLTAFNRRGAFDNLDDTEEGLRGDPRGFASTRSSSRSPAPPPSSRAKDQGRGSPLVEA